MDDIDRDVAALRRKDEHGLTTRERQVLTLRATEKLLWVEIAALLSVSKFRVTEIKQNLEKKGMIDSEGEPTDLALIALGMSERETNG